MEFRNHQARLGHYVVAMRGSPLLLLLAVLLLPLLVAIVVGIAVVATVSIGLLYLGNSLASIITGKKPRSPLSRTADSILRRDPRDRGGPGSDLPPGTGQVIDVDVIKKE